MTTSAALLASLAILVGSQPNLTLTPIGTYSTKLFDQSGAEILGYHAGTERLYSVNGGKNTIDMLDLRDPTSPKLIKRIPMWELGPGANSLAVHGDLIAVAIEAEARTQRGRVALFDPEGNLLSSVQVGYLPDMICFTRDGSKLLVANEGEPTSSYGFDPEGSVSIIDLSVGARNVRQDHVTDVNFRAFNDSRLDPSVRVFGPGATAAQDFEPECITVTSDSKTAYVTLQENTAIAVIDIDAGKVTRVMGLGFKDHSAEGSGLDASDKDYDIRIRRWPVKGMYLPDGIASFKCDGTRYLITANEGDSRDNDGFNEEARVRDLELDDSAFSDADSLKEKENLGRLQVTTTLGDADGDGEYEELYAFGARSFSIWTTDGRLVSDSGDQFERIIAKQLPSCFNSDYDDNNSFDKRSDNKGPEPEGIALGVINGRGYAFIGLERTGGVMVFDFSYPKTPRFVTYVSNRNFDGDPEAGTAGDLAPDGLTFIPASASPNGKPLLAVANRVSGTVTIYQINAR